jgi:hypothetical protein
VQDILRNGFNLEKGVRFAYGKGIYCKEGFIYELYKDFTGTPDPRVALQYAFDYSFNEEPVSNKSLIIRREERNKLVFFAVFFNFDAFF